MARTPVRVEPHPDGGTLSYFDLENGVHVSVLGDGYPFADDYEVQQVDPEQQNAYGLPRAIYGTEERAPDWDGVWMILDALEADESPTD